MIIELLLDFLFEIIKLIPTLGIPEMPTEIGEVINMLFEYLAIGCRICNVFFPMHYFGTLLSIILGIEVCLLVYHFVMWVIKKLPISSE